MVFCDAKGSQRNIRPLPLVAPRIVQSGDVLLQILGIAVVIAVLVSAHGEYIGRSRLQCHARPG
jgi:hypothetical protein